MWGRGKNNIEIGGEVEKCGRKIEEGIDWRKRRFKVKILNLEGIQKSGGNEGEQKMKKDVN